MTRSTAHPVTTKVVGNSLGSALGLPHVSSCSAVACGWTNSTTVPSEAAAAALEHETAVRVRPVPAFLA